MSQSTTRKIDIYDYLTDDELESVTNIYVEAVYFNS